MRARPRDFIFTSDDLFFATTTYLHPQDRILSFLRYIPDQNGDRLLNSKKYSKVDSKQAYDFLGKHFQDYLFDCEITGVQMMGVPKEKIEKIPILPQGMKTKTPTWNNIRYLFRNVHVSEIFIEKESANVCIKGITELHWEVLDLLEVPHGVYKNTGKNWWLWSGA